MTVEPFSGLHVLQSNGFSILDGITLLRFCPRHRFYNPVAVGISDAREASNRLLTTAGSIRHIVRMQTKLRLLVHQLYRTPITYLDTFFTGRRCGGGRGVAGIGIKAEVKEESEAEESHSHQEEESDEPVLLIKGKLGARFPRRGSS